MKKTKIICTLGPASDTEETISDLIDAGMNVARINFSHGTYEEQADKIEKIKRVRARKNAPIAIMLDTKGPEFRIGTFKDGKIFLNDGDTFTFTTEKIEGDQSKVSVSFDGICEQLNPGDKVLLNDGLMIFEVLKVKKPEVICKTIVGGELSNRKSMFFPDKNLDMVYLSEQDKSDIAFGVKLGIDYIACSFVSRAQDIIDIRNWLKECGSPEGDIEIIAKIEIRAGVNNIDEILEASDGIMVARGDLGVEIPFEEVPNIQKMIIHKCRIQGKRSITATEMLESMIKNPRPTRAEISDVANAVYDGTSAVMLSGETAMGDYPINAVSIMKRVILMTEQDSYYKRAMSITTLPPDQTIASAITASVHQIAQVLKKPACVVCYSVTGKTTLRTARERTLVPILGLTIDEKIANKLALVWGVQSHVTKQLQDMVEVTPIALSMAEKLKLAESGDEIIITAGIPFAKKGNTNILHIAMVK